MSETGTDAGDEASGTEETAGEGGYSGASEEAPFTGQSDGTNDGDSSVSDAGGGYSGESGGAPYSGFSSGETSDPEWCTVAGVQVSASSAKTFVDEFQKCTSSKSLPIDLSSSPDEIISLALQLSEALREGGPTVTIAEIIAGTAGVALSEELAFMLEGIATMTAATVLAEITACAAVAGWESSSFGF